MADDDVIVLSSEDEGEVVVKKKPLKLNGTNNINKKKKNKDEPSKNGTKSDETASSSSATPSPTPASPVECINIDDELEELLSQSATVPEPKPLSDEEKLQNVIDDLVYTLRNLMKPAERNLVKKKLEQKMRKIDWSSEETSAKEMIDFVVERTQRIVKKNSTKWSNLDHILKFLDSKSSRRHPEKKVKKSTAAPDETEEERAARKKQKNIIKLEKHLKTLEDNIRKWDEREVDLDDERNSSYLVRTRMVNVYMKQYKILCKEAGANYYTGRPIEKRLKLADGLTHTEIQEAIEKYMNAKDILFIPDYHDIENIVIKVNKDSQSPLIPQSDVQSVAKTLFQEVVRILRCRRRQDFDIAVPLESIAEPDPADIDPELQKKLEENDKNRGSEQHVLESFAKKQEEEQEDAVEVDDENPDGSAEESDDESDDEDLAAEGDADENGEQDDGAKQIYSRDQADEEDDDEAENTEKPDENAHKLNEEEVEKEADEDDEGPSSSKKQRIE